MPSPDDVCLVCMQTRENHGDAHHKFNMVDDQVVPLDPPPKPTAAAPRSRDEAAREKELAERQNGKAIATLLEVLSEKGIIDTKDTIRILMGHG